MITRIFSCCFSFLTFIYIFKRIIYFSRLYITESTLKIDSLISKLFLNLHIMIPGSYIYRDIEAMLKHSAQMLKQNIEKFDIENQISGSLFTSQHL